MRAFCFLALLLCGCNGGPSRPPAAPIYHEADAQLFLDGEKVPVSVNMEAYEEWWEISGSYLWFMSASYRVPRPFTLRPVDDVLCYHWHDDYLEERFHTNSGDQRFARKSSPHRSKADFWLSNARTGSGVMVTLPVWK